jgi:nitrogen fixation protein FixH
LPASLSWISAHRWPLGVVGILLMTFSANAVLLFQATRPDAAAPIEDYYARSLRWDETLALRESSRALGWTAAWDLPAGPEYAPSMPRPVDLSLTDREGLPLRGIRGTLTALRPSDPSLTEQAQLTELPHAPGVYRCLLRFPVDGVWEIQADLSAKGTEGGGTATRWVATRRLQVTSVAGAP